MTRRLNWAVISTANIAQTHLIPAIQQAANAQLHAIASRDAGRARAVADVFSIPGVFDCYDSLINSEEVDVVYIPLPNDQHIDWSIKALEAGKHVLCEKPLGLNTPDVERLLRAADSNPAMKVMEAFMYRHHPQWAYVVDRIRSGAIGDVRSVHAQFTFNRDEPNDYRNRPEAGGGGLLDVGCYGISAARWIFHDEPTQVCGFFDIDQRYGVDKMFTGLLDFGQGRSATVLAGTKSEPGQCVRIIGEAGSILLDQPFYSEESMACKVTVCNNYQTKVTEFEPGNHYRAMVDQFSLSILEKNAVPLSLEDSLSNMRVIDAFFASVTAQSWVPLG